MRGNPRLEICVVVRVVEDVLPAGVAGFGASQRQVETCEKQVDVLQQLDRGDVLPFRAHRLRPIEDFIDATQRRLQDEVALLLLGRRQPAVRLGSGGSRFAGPSPHIFHSASRA